MASVEIATPEWITAAEFGRRGGWPRQQVHRFADAGLVTVKRGAAGFRPRYLASDVDALVESLIVRKSAEVMV